MSNLIGNTSGYLIATALMQKMATKSSISTSQFILDFGLECRVQPNSFPRYGKFRECFMNALNYATENGMIYCEGYACGVIPVLHAWCIDKEGNVIDPTWEKGKDYIGVPFKTDYVLDFTERHLVYDSVIENYRDKWALLVDENVRNNAIHPDLTKLRDAVQL
jgi:hypothetical protein